MAGSKATAANGYLTHIERSTHQYIRTQLAVDVMTFMVASKNEDPLFKDGVVPPKVIGAEEGNDVWAVNVLIAKL